MTACWLHGLTACTSSMRMLAIVAAAVCAVCRMDLLADLERSNVRDNDVLLRMLLWPEPCALLPLPPLRALLSCALLPSLLLPLPLPLTAGDFRGEASEALECCDVSVSGKRTLVSP